MRAFLLGMGLLVGCSNVDREESQRAATEMNQLKVELATRDQDLEHLKVRVKDLEAQIQAGEKTKVDVADYKELKATVERLEKELERANQEVERFKKGENP